MNNKAIMLKFLTTIILAIIIFAPACMISSRFFRLSSQAENNFNTFIEEIRDLNENGEVGEVRNNLLILDKGTALVYFSGPVLQIGVVTDGEENYQIKSLRPKSCGLEASQGCFCLFRESTITESDLANMIVINPRELFCKSIDFQMALTDINCGVGLPEKVLYYKCENGFLIDRDLISQKRDFYYQNFRRVNLKIEKKESVVEISPPGGHKSSSGG
jgi:hypothetical protein